MKLNGKIQIVGGNPEGNKVLTCTDNRGNCEWLEIPNSGNDNFVDGGSLVGNTLTLTTTSGSVIEIDLSSLSTSGTPGTNGVGVTSTVNNGDGTFTITYSDGTSFTSSDLTGPKGADGKNGVNGVGVTNTVNNGDGTFTINYSDGTSFTSSDLTGPPGNDGTATDTFVNNMNINKHQLTVSRTDGQLFSADLLPYYNNLSFDSNTNTLTLDDGSSNTISTIDLSQFDNTLTDTNTFLSSASLQGNDLMLGLNSGTDLSVDLSSLNTNDTHLSSAQLIDSGASRCLGKALRLTMSDGTNIDVDVNDLFTDNHVKNLQFDDSTNILRLSHWDNREGCGILPAVEVDLSSLSGGGSGSDKYLSTAQIIQTTNESNSGGQLQQKGGGTPTDTLRLTMSDSTNIDVDLSDISGTGSGTNNSLWFDKPTGNNIYRDIGNVGIGLDSPQRKLHIKGADGILRLETTQSKGSNYFEYHDDTKIKGRIGYIETKQDDLDIINDINAGDIRFATNTDRFNMVITDGGVGISNTGGANSIPNNALSVRGSTSIVATTGKTDSVISFRRDLSSLTPNHSGVINHNVDENEYSIDLAYATGANAPTNWTHKDINLSINDSTKLSIDGSDGKVSVTDDLYIGGTVQINGGNPGSGKVLTSDGSGNATWQTPTGGSGSGSDSYITQVDLLGDAGNMNVLRLTRNNGLSDLSVSLNSLVTDPTAARTDKTTITTTTNNETVTVTHTVNTFYPVFTVYHVNRDKVILPEAVGMVNYTGSIPLNQVTGPHQLDQIDMTFAEPGTYIISFVG